MKQASAAEAARSRSELYILLARALAFPQPEFHEEAVDGRLRQRIDEALQELPYRVAAGPSRGWSPVGDYESFQSEYIRLFEVGPRGHALCPLHSGHYGRNRVKTMEELVRFYNYFGLRITPGLMPDHVTTELEFMHYLSDHEAEAGQTGGDVESYQRAQRDFLKRHLNRWWPLALTAAQRQRPQRFYRSLMNLMLRFLAAERRHLTSVLRGG